MKKNFSVRNLLRAILSIVLVVAVLFGGYVFYRCAGDKSGATHLYSEAYTQDPVVMNVKSDGKFKVLKINDTHFINGTCENDKKTLDYIKNVLDKTYCNLIIIDGDLVDGFNLKPSYDKYKAIDTFAKLIDRYGIPWTFAPGNNDGEIDGNNKAVIAYLMNYNNFVFGNALNIDGEMQFFIDIYSEGNRVHSIAIMDSGMRTLKLFGKYDYISSDQVEWLNKGVLERNVSTSVFFHMPTPEFQVAYEKGKAYKGFKKCKASPYDGIAENKLFDAMTEENHYISLISCAHLHSNSMCSYYNGRYYQLSSAGGYSASYDSSIKPSCTLITITPEAKTTQSMYKFSYVS